MHIAGSGEPLYVLIYDVDRRQYTRYTIADEYGRFSLGQIDGRRVQIIAWQDNDGDGYFSEGDLLGYYGYSGGNPLDGAPITLSLVSGASHEINFSYAPIIDTTSKPTWLNLSEEALDQIKELIGDKELQ